MRSIISLRLSPTSLPGQGGQPGGGGLGGGGGHVFQPGTRIQPTGTPSPAPAPAMPSQSTVTLTPGAPAPAQPAPRPPAPPADGESPAVSKIRAFGQGLAGGHHSKEWKRPTNLTGKGATHVKSFHCKLTGDSLENLDKQINEWLDSHPDYEVKLVNASVGEWLGKLKEPNLILQVWV